MGRMAAMGIEGLLGLLARGGRAVGPAAVKGVKAIGRGGRSWLRDRSLLAKGGDLLTATAIPPVLGSTLHSGKGVVDDVRGFIDPEYLPASMRRAKKVAEAQAEMDLLGRAKVRGDTRIEELFGEGLRRGEEVAGRDMPDLRGQANLLEDLYRQNQSELDQMAVRDQGGGGLSHLLARYV